MNTIDTNNYIIVSLTIYKVCSLLVGYLSIYLGYKLFAKGIWGESGDLEANFSNNKLVLKKAAPGTFFVVLGTIIILGTVYKGLDFKNEINIINPAKTEDNGKPPLS